MSVFYAGFMLSLLAVIGWMEAAALVRAVLDCLRAAEGLRRE